MTWNLFGKSGRKVGEADGATKEEVERVARDELGLDVSADYKRPKVHVPIVRGWWSKRTDEEEE